MTQLLGSAPDAAAPAATLPGPGASAASPPARGLAETVGAVTAATGLARVRIVAWRDLDDPEAGGSELHAHRIAGQWARAGLDVEVRTSAVGGLAELVERDGYRVVRRSGRYSVFARAGTEAVLRGARADEGLVEVWNGMPFWSPLWFRGPKVVFLHHVHAEMWRMVLPPRLARLGDWAERGLAPPLYRTTRIVTLSESSKDEIVSLLGFDPARVSVAPPGIDPRFSPDPGVRPSSEPLVVAVGRLVPVKRFDLLLRALARVREHHPRLRAAVLGEGYERPRLEALRRDLGATAWVELPGRVTDARLVDAYRRAWLVAATSLREGWGMTLTEAGACGTPAVATDIAGHRDAVVHGRTGLLCADEAGLASAISDLLADTARRAALGAAAREYAAGFSWEAAAASTFAVLADEARRVRYRSVRRVVVPRHAATTADAPRNATATAASEAASA